MFKSGNEIRKQNVDEIHLRIWRQNAKLQQMNDIIDV